MQVSREFLLSIYKEIRAGDGLEVVKRLRKMLNIKEDKVVIKRGEDVESKS